MSSNAYRLQICKLGLPEVKDLVQSGKARIKFHKWAVSVVLHLQQKVLIVTLKKKRVAQSWTETCVKQQEMAVGEGEMKRREPGAMGMAASSPQGRMTLVFSSPYSMEGSWPPATADHPTQPASYWFICSNFIKCLYCARNWDDCWELNV